MRTYEKFRIVFGILKAIGKTIEKARKLANYIQKSGSLPLTCLQSFRKLGESFTPQLKAVIHFS